jgi:hypothetical protein
MRTTPEAQDKPLDLTGTKATKPAPPPAPARQVAPGIVEINGKLQTKDYMPPKLPHWGGELLLGQEPEPHDRKGGPDALSELLKRKAEWVGSHPGASVAQIDAAHAAIAAEMGL